MKITMKNSDLQKWLYPAHIVANAASNNKGEWAGLITILANKKGVAAYANNGYVAVVTDHQSNESYKFEDGGDVTVKTSDFLNSVQSFPAEEDITLSLNGNEFSIVLASDPEENVSMPVENKSVVIPVEAVSFAKEATIKKDIFIKLMEKVVFAIGYEERRPEFLHWMLRLKNKQARAVCGNGRRFSVYDIEGDGIFDCKTSVNILFFKEHNNVLQKLLAFSKSDTINIKEHIQSNDDDPYYNQTVVSMQDFRLILINHNPGLKWVDENKFLLRENTQRFTTKVSDWEGAIKSIKATITQDVKKQQLFHWTAMNFDAEKNVVNVSSSVCMKLNRKVPVLDGNGSINYKCLSKYLIEVFDMAELDEYVQWEFDGASSAAVVRFYASTKVSNPPLEKVNISAGLKESHALFFAAYNKDSN